MKDFGILIPTGICVCVGTYLILRPQQYIDELKGFERIISSSPRWAIRILGVVIIAVGIGVLYLSLHGQK